MKTLRMVFLGIMLQYSLDPPLFQHLYFNRVIFVFPVFSYLRESYARDGARVLGL